MTINTLLGITFLIKSIYYIYKYFHYSNDESLPKSFIKIEILFYLVVGLLMIFSTLINNMYISLTIWWNIWQIG